MPRGEKSKKNSTMRLKLNDILFKYRSWLLVSIFFAGVFIFLSAKGNVFLNYENALLKYNEIKYFIQQDTQTAQLLYFFLYLFIVTFSLPFATFLTILGSALFGWSSLFIILFAASIGACLLFLAARTILSDWLYNRTLLHKSIIRPDFEENSFFILLGLRLLPVAPFWIINILPAFTTISLKSYFAATFFGIMPGTILYVWFGNTIDALLSKGERPNILGFVDSRIWMPLTGFGLLILITAIYRLFESKINKKK